MLYTGKTYDTAGRVVSVEIVTGNDRSRHIEIGAPESGLMLDSEEALTIEGETNDIFDVILRQSAIVRLKARDFVPDLFRSDCREATVVMKVGEHTVFDGFILPRTYSQGYNSALDTLEVNCIDRLGALQWLTWRETMSGNPTYQEAITECAQRTIRDILTRALALVDIDSLDVISAPLVEEGGVSALDGILVDERRFMGDDEESVWTAEEVVTECLRYLNLHIAHDGDRVIVFSWDDLKNASVYAVTQRTAYGSNSKLDIGEVFNRIEVTCETEEIDDFIPDPLGDDSYSSPFSGNQLYLKEFSFTKGDPTHEGSLFLSSRGTNLIYPAGEESYWMREWWIRVLEAKGWRLFGRTAQSKKWDCMIPLSAAKLADDFYSFGDTWQNRYPDGVNRTQGAMFVELTGGKTEPKKKDNSIAIDSEREKYMVIGVGGDGIERSKSDFIGHISEQFKNMLDLSVPRAAFSGGYMQLSPSDDTTTRYLDISGKIAFAPVSETIKPSKDVVDFNQVPATKYKEGDLRRFYREYYKAENPGDTPEINDFSLWVSNMGFDVFCEEEALKRGEYISVYTGNSFIEKDVFSKIRALRCMLIVGDKCLVEHTRPGETDSYRWERFHTIGECADRGEFLAQSFTIGFDPKIGDYIIGKEYDIWKNAHYSLQLDTKGTIIPIRKSDNLHGEVTFLILGPETDTLWPLNMCLNIPYTLSSMPDNTETGQQDSSLLLLNYVSGIWLKDFNIRIISDNAGNDPLNENDLVYVSDTDESFINPKDDITMRIHSDLTAEERASFGVRDVTRNSTAIDADSGTGLLSVWDPRLGVQAKPEQLYVDWYYRECHRPHVEIEQSIRTGSNKTMMWCYTIPAMRRRRFYPVSVSRDLQQGAATVRMRSIDNI